MAQVQFPSGPADGATYTVNNVTYTWSATNSLWTANNSTDLNSLFVAVAGDTMTGDLVASTTGALTIPVGTEAEKPGSPLAGATRLNTTSGFTEIYTGATLGWKDLAYTQAPATLPADLTYSSDATVGGIIECNNLTINAGVTLTLNQKAVVFRVYGDAIINGTIEGTGLGSIGGTARAILAAAGASEGLFALAGQGFGNNGLTAYPPVASLLGSGGQSGFVSNGPSAVANYSSSGAGGNSGGSIVVRCNGSITMGGAINAVGQDGPYGFIGFGDLHLWTGSGGGSGGAVILHSDGPINYTGTISVAGGKGGLPYATPGIGNEVGSGGGGGGGWVILQTPSTLTNSGTTTLTGGAGGGASAGTIGGGGLGGSTGGSFAGTGGIGAAAGTNGQLIFTGSPF